MPHKFFPGNPRATNMVPKRHFECGGYIPISKVKCPFPRGIWIPFLINTIHRPTQVGLCNRALQHMGSQLFVSRQCVYACQFYANMRLLHISLVAAFFAYFTKVRISHIFST